MTGVAQMQKPKHCGQEKLGLKYSDVFALEQLNKTQSILFAKKLLAVSISNITYLRAIFPESAFGDRALEDLHLKILRDDSKCPGASQVIKWVRGCFDALEKNYLRQIILGIYVDPTKEDTLIESYTFRFSYEHQGSLSLFRNGEHVASAKSSTQTKKATVSLLRTLMLLMQSLHPLPDQVLMTMKLLYYDKITPPDYEPDGFKPAQLDYFMYETETTNITIGKVNTPFHQMRLNVKTDAKQFNMKEDPLPDNEEIQISPKTKKNDEESQSIIQETQDCVDLENIPVSPNNSISENEFTNKTLDLQKMDTLELDKDSPPKQVAPNEKIAQLGSYNAQVQCASNKQKTADKAKPNKLGLSKTKSLYSAKEDYLEVDPDETELLSENTSKLSVATKSCSRKIDLKVQKCSNDGQQRDKGIKRVIPVSNKAYEFDLETLLESQEIPSQEFPRRSKRKKVSSTNMPLFV